MFVCDYCDKTFGSAYEAEKHEAEECGLSVEDYREWRKLDYQCSEAGKKVGICKNDKTDEEFDAAINAVCDFEKQHHLENIKKPSNWN